MPTTTLASFILAKYRNSHLANVKNNAKEPMGVREKFYSVSKCAATPMLSVLT